MKRLLSILSLALISIFALPAQTNDIGLPQEAIEQLTKAVRLVDLGLSEAAMTDFDALLKQYPDNYYIQYERLFALNSLERYKDAKSAAKKLLKHKDATMLTFHLCGKLFFNSGDIKTAKKIYNDGLKRFPKSDLLLSELAYIDLLDDNYNDAWTKFNAAIDENPNLSTPYFFGASICFSAEDYEVWGLIYAETAVLLEPQNEERKAVATEWIRNCLNGCIDVDYCGDSLQIIKVSMAPSVNMYGDPSGYFIDIRGVYERCTSMALLDMLDNGNKEVFTGTISQMAELRKGVIERICMLDEEFGLYGKGMYLFPFLKRIIDAGYWEAYNYYFFGSTCPDEYDEWIMEHEQNLDDFIDWYNQSPFALDEENRVGINTINLYSKPLTIIEAMSAISKVIKEVKEDDESEGVADGEVESE